jgi:hypothetical protein
MYPHNQNKKTRAVGAVLVPVSARFPMAPRESIAAYR